MKVKKYKLPVDPEIRQAYTKIFKHTESFDWENGFICADHWNSRVRETSKQLPDAELPDHHFEIIKKKWERAQHTFQAATTPSTSQRSMYERAKKRFVAAQSIMQKKTVVLRPPPKMRGTLPAAEEPPMAMDVNDHDEERIQHLENDLKEKNEEIEKLKRLLSEKDLEITNLNNKVSEQTRKINYLTNVVEMKSQFTFENIKSDSNHFEYLTGLSLEQFGVIWDCVHPYIESCLRYGDDRKPTEKTFSYQTQYLIVLMICRHGLDLRFAAFMAKVSEQTIGRVFNGWIIFLATLFNQLDQRPDQDFLRKTVPEIFTRTGHEMTDLILDATEFKFQTASNFDVSTLMFSHYKNTTTGKALIGISPHGMGIIFSEIYPGSISDTEITEKTDILSYVNEDHEIMTDRGFAIQDLCAIKKVSLNRPKQKDSTKIGFGHGEIHRNFDIAATRIHVERYIGRVRNWRILNNIWPLNRIDMLSSTWQMLCHTVNLVCPPIGPRVEESS